MRELQMYQQKMAIHPLSSLGIVGYEQYEPVILAALALEFPLLLIGNKGTAKSMLVYTLARALHAELRAYNCSLINYEDLVGIPMPPDDYRNGLEFIYSPAAIWPAEMVFLDELSRTRPDMANKLFSIVHEKQIMGMALPHLRWRLAAMNPPSQPDFEQDPANDFYVGVEPLDQALADRFPMLIIVPDWEDFSEEEQRKIIAASDVDTEAPLISLPELLQQITSRMADVETKFHDQIEDYTLSAMSLLRKANLPQSPRRARMFFEAIMAIHAARIVLDETADLEQSVKLALLTGIPQLASENPPTEYKLHLIHQQAWTLSVHMQDPRWRQVFRENNPIDRIVLADELDFDDSDLSILITQALQSEEDTLHRDTLAIALFWKFHTKRNLTAATFAVLAPAMRTIATPKMLTTNDPGRVLDNIVGWMETHNLNHEISRIQRNFLLTRLQQWGETDWYEANDYLVSCLKWFGMRAAVAEKPSPNAFPARRSSRFGSTARDRDPITELATVGIRNTFVRFDLSFILDILTESFHQEFTNVSQAARWLEQENPMMDNLKNYLDTLWVRYGLKGAALLYPWNTELSQALALYPTGITFQGKEGSKSDTARASLSARIAKPVQLWNATDPALVLNVLARSPSDTLLADRPLALESAFLTRSLVTDDARLVRLVEQTSASQGTFDYAG
jgi:MoxR-like ATPase